MTTGVDPSRTLLRKGYSESHSSKKFQCRNVDNYCGFSAILEAESSKNGRPQMYRVRTSPTTQTPTENGSVTRSHGESIPNIHSHRSRPVHPFQILPSPRAKTRMTVYVCIFICFSSKAVHLEVVENQSTDAFIAALMRFTSLRGRPEVIYADNGRNLIEARRELAELKKIYSNKLF